jgi:hypothetical protein
LPLVRKEILAPGTIWGGDVDGVERFHTFEADDVRRIYATGTAMRKAGLSIPVPLEHQALYAMTPAERAADQLLNNRGWVESFELTDDCVLYGNLDIPDPDLAEKLPHTIKWVSPFILPEYTDGDGNVWHDAPAHVALTLYPRILHQEPFGAVAASLIPPKLLPTPAGGAVPWAACKTGLACSMNFAVVPLKGGTTWAPAYPDGWANSNGVFLAAEWAPHTDAKTGKQGWKSKGGAVRYTQPPKADMANPASPKATRTTSAATNPAGGKSAPETPEQKSAREETAKMASKTTAREAHVARQGIGPHVDSIGMLTTPGLKGAAAKVGRYPEELALTSKALANSKAMFTTLKKKNASPAKLAAAIEAAIDKDKAAIAKGKTHAPSGGSYVARLVGYRHMLQWAEDQLSAATERVPSALEKAEAHEFDRKLSDPLPSRLAHIDEKLHLNTPTGVVPGKKRFAAWVGLDVAQAPDNPAGLSEETLNLLKAAASPDGRYVQTHEANGEPIKNNDGQPTTKVWSVGATGKTPTEIRLGAVAQVLSKIKSGQITPEQIYPTLQGKAKNGIGVLSPNEFKDLLSEAGSTGIAASLLGKTDRGVSKNQTATGKTTPALALSTGDQTMAADDEPLKDNNDALFSDEEIADVPADVAVDNGEGGAEDKLPDVIAKLKEHGIKVPDETTCDEFVNALYIALDAAKHAKIGMADETGADTNPMTPEAPVEESNGLMMSLLKHTDPAIRKLAQETQELKKEKHQRFLDDCSTRINRLIKVGLKPPLAKALKAELAGMAMSGTGLATQNVATKLSLLEQQMAGNKDLTRPLSDATVIDNPRLAPGTVLTPEDVKRIAKEQGAGKTRSG